jgi:hypothetical protein
MVRSSGIANGVSMEVVERVKPKQTARQKREDVFSPQHNLVGYLKRLAG